MQTLKIIELGDVFIKPYQGDYLVCSFPGHLDQQMKGIFEDIICYAMRDKCFITMKRDELLKMEFAYNNREALEKIKKIFDNPDTKIIFELEDKVENKDKK